MRAAIMSELHEAYIGFGANVGNCTATFRNAIKDIGRSIGTVEAKSKLYTTKALTAPDGDKQENYLNGVLLSYTTLSPPAVLEELLSIEKKYGRVRDTETRWSARTIDLDLLSYDGVVIDEPGLKLPHPELHKRDFVLVPFNEIAPDYMHPVLLRTISELLSEYHKAGSERFVLGTENSPA